MNNEQNYTDNLTSIERWKSILLDHAILCFTILPFFIIPVLIGSAISIGTHNIWIKYVPLSVLFAIYFNKDILGGRSVAKRILGQIVIDNKTNKPASEIKCAIRNFTIFFWLIEVVVVLISPNRRIGDFIANTRIVRTEKQDWKYIWHDFQKATKTMWILPFTIATIYILAILKFIE